MIAMCDAKAISWASLLECIWDMHARLGGSQGRSGVEKKPDNSLNANKDPEELTCINDLAIFYCTLPH